VRADANADVVADGGAFEAVGGHSGKGAVDDGAVDDGAIDDGAGVIDGHARGLPSRGTQATPRDRQPRARSVDGRSRRPVR
jgi:hypothetical protein